MADGIESYSNDRQLAKYRAGIQGSDFFGEPNPAPAMTVVEGYPPEVAQKLMSSPIPQPPVTDPWVVRYPNAKL